MFTLDEAIAYLECLPDTVAESAVLIKGEELKLRVESVRKVSIGVGSSEDAEVVNS